MLTCALRNTGTRTCGNTYPACMNTHEHTCAHSHTPTIPCVGRCNSQGPGGSHPTPSSSAPVSSGAAEGAGCHWSTGRPWLQGRWAPRASPRFGDQRLEGFPAPTASIQAAVRPRHAWVQTPHTSRPSTGSGAQASACTRFQVSRRPRPHTSRPVQSAGSTERHPVTWDLLWDGDASRLREWLRRAAAASF